jgi:ribosomal protein S19E (S16A)
VAYLTDEQAAILAWMVESGSYGYAFETMLDGSSRLGTRGGDRPVKASDVRELEAQGLIRPAGKGYELTNAGRSVYRQLKSPRTEPPPVGFQPPD